VGSYEGSLLGVVQSLALRQAWFAVLRGRNGMETMMIRNPVFNIAAEAPDPTIFALSGVSPNGIGERNTISSGPDDGTLNKDAAVFWNPLRHGTSTVLANNLVGNTATEKACNVCAHGNVGFFETGAGQKLPYGPGLYVFTWNQSDWQPQFQRLGARNYLQMTIWACETGQGQDGADLLYAIAQTAGCAVRATNGLVWTNGQSIWLEAGAVWVTATPTQRPSPVGPPHHLTMALEKDNTLLIRVAGKLMRISPKNVSQIRIERFGIMKRRRAAFLLSGAAAQELAWRLFASKPFKMPGTPSAFITARAEVTLRPSRGKAAQKRSLVIYNDRLVYDTTSQEAYYARPGTSFAV
jgi:hypothetical protein